MFTTLGQMIRLCFSFTLSIVMVLSTQIAVAAQNNPLVLVVDDLNYNSSIQNMKDQLKDFYNTSKDHKDIDSAFKRVSRVGKKWQWRYELKGDKILFRVNGKVQFEAKAVKNKPNTFLINGNHIVLHPKDSFYQVNLKLQKLVQKKQALWNRLFFNEADAIGIFGILLAVGGVFLVTRWIGSRRAHAAPPANQGYDETQSIPKPKGYVGEPAPQTKRPSLFSRRPNVKSCLSQASITNRNNAQIASGVGDGHYTGRHNCNGFNPDLTRRVRLIAVNMYTNGRKFRSIDDCTRAKMESCSKQGWSMTNRNAYTHCQMADEMYQACANGGQYQKSSAEESDRRVINPVDQ